jgi:hypothetical protein
VISRRRPYVDAVGRDYLLEAAANKRGHTKREVPLRRVIGVALALALLASQTIGTASAQSATPPGATTRVPTRTIAIAIGQLIEDDGERATVDMRGATDGARAGGALRFYSADHGYYNGAVRTLAVENGTIKATGRGGLIKPDGTRAAVQYTATITPDKRVEIVVTGRNGFTYTLAGRLDPGFVETK